MIENMRKGMPSPGKQTPSPPTKLHELQSMLEIQKQLQKNVIILHLTGKLNSHTASLLQREVGPLTQAGTCSIILEMTALVQIDSAGVGILVSIYKELQTHNQSLQLVSLQGQPYDIFKLLNLHKVIKIVPNLEEALKQLP